MKLIMENWREFVNEVEFTKRDPEDVQLTMAIASNFLDSCKKSVRSASIAMQKKYNCTFVKTPNQGTHVSNDVKSVLHSVSFGGSKKDIRFNFLKNNGLTTTGVLDNGFAFYEALIKKNPKKEDKITQIVATYGVNAFKVFLHTESRRALKAGNISVGLDENSMYIVANLKIAPCSLVEDWHPDSSWAVKPDRIENFFTSTSLNWMNLDSELLNSIGQK